MFVSGKRNRDTWGQELEEELFFIVYHFITCEIRYVLECITY